VTQQWKFIFPDKIIKKMLSSNYRQIITTTYRIMNTDGFTFKLWHYFCKLLNVKVTNLPIRLTSFSWLHYQRD